MDQDVVEQLWDLVTADPALEVTVDLVGKQILAGSLRATFDVDDYGRWRLLEGLDDVDLTLRHADEIAAFEAARPSWKPRTLPALT